MAGCYISSAVAGPVGYGVVLDVAAVLLCLTGDVSVRSVAFGDCSNYCHDVFGGEQSDASCCVWHGGLRCCWSSSSSCWRLRSGRCRRAVRPLGPWCAKLVGNALWWSVWPAVRPLRAAKRRLNRAAHRGSFLPCRRSVSCGTTERLSFRRRQPTSSGEGCWGISLPFRYLEGVL